LSCGRNIRHAAYGGTLFITATWVYFAQPSAKTNPYKLPTKIGMHYPYFGSAFPKTPVTGLRYGLQFDCIIEKNREKYQFINDHPQHYFNSIFCIIK
jgi:hypothetical protein